MIKIENTVVYGWDAAIRGMRNPMNSWAKADSRKIAGCVIVGPNDLTLMKKLVASGPDHAKFMRMIAVTCDVTAPLYWWKEFDTYKIGTTANSCSTMHTIHKKDFALDDFSHEHLFTVDLLGTIYTMNEYRKQFLACDDPEMKKTYWYQMIQLLPSSYNQRRTLQLNYAVLRNMYHARKNHKLDEWRQFCVWAERLPHSELIAGKRGER
ncbi:MAG TPA: hypothetical protein DDX59_06655 [Lachnospiraceae bacterium]|nr:hypothetical protein [Lachnospiraceae bacterium]